MKPPVVAMAVLACIFSSAQISAADPELSDSVVRITVTRRGPNLVQPWTKASPAEQSGTGFVIDGQQIITNAHVVDYASQIYVQPNKSADKFEAKVKAFSVDMDLAVLVLDDPAFFNSRSPIPFHEGIPKIKSPVNVYGFPVGGEQMSVTEGIISRIEYTRYLTGIAGLRIQIDAALNPGNSGGPAVSNGKLIGVAFQVLQQAENVGYIIPVEELIEFLKDIQDGTYEGKPQLLGDLQTVENDALRAKLGLGRGVGGAMVTRVAGTNESVLKVGDVITHVGDSALDQASRIRVGDELTLPFIYLVPKLVKDGKVPLQILRDGNSMTLEVPVSVREPELVPSLRGGYPRFFICGPLVFSAATREYMNAVGRAGGVMMLRGSPFFTRLQDRPAFAGEELVVVASPMFSHKLTKGYSQPIGACLRSVNGTPVKNLVGLVELIRDATGEFIEFDFIDRATERMVFRRAELLESTEEILTDNGIRNQCSDDLIKVWKAK